MQATDIARERYALHQRIRHRIRTDLGDGSGTLNQKLAAWWKLDFRTFRNEVAKALKTDIPLKERPDWEKSLTEWRDEHTGLTSRLVAAETEINDRVYGLFGLGRDDIKFLDDHGEKAKINYPLGAV